MVYECVDVVFTSSDARMCHVSEKLLKLLKSIVPNVSHLNINWGRGTI